MSIFYLIIGYIIFILVILQLFKIDVIHRFRPKERLNYRFWGVLISSFVFFIVFLISLINSNYLYSNFKEFTQLEQQQVDSIVIQFQKGDFQLFQCQGISIKSENRVSVYLSTLKQKMNFGGNHPYPIWIVRVIFNLKNKQKHCFLISKMSNNIVAIDYFGISDGQFKGPILTYRCDKIENLILEDFYRACR